MGESIHGPGPRGDQDPVRTSGDPAARLRLWCLPHAGGGAVVFHSWPAILAPAVQVSPIRLAGRETRLKEPPCPSMAPLVREVADTIGPHVRQPFAIFGHSMGAIVGFELARELRRRTGTSPVHLFVSACRPPHRRLTDADMSGLPQARLLEEVQRRYGMLDPSVQAFPELLTLLVPALRADLAALETYQYVEEPPLACPITAFGGSSDRAVSGDDLAGWRLHTAGPFDRHILPGGHDCLTSSRDELLHAIAKRLRTADRASSAAAAGHHGSDTTVLREPR